MKTLGLSVIALLLTSPLVVANDDTAAAGATSTSEHSLDLTATKQADGTTTYAIKGVKHKKANHDNNKDVETLFSLPGASMTLPNGMRVMMG